MLWLMSSALVDGEGPSYNLPAPAPRGGTQRSRTGLQPPPRGAGIAAKDRTDMPVPASPTHTTALEATERARVSRLAGVDVVVGLPSYKNTRTIEKVMTAVAEGISALGPSMTGIIVVSDGGSTDDTLSMARKVPLPPHVNRVVTEYRGVTGKGSAIRAVLEVADLAKASACAIIDADVRSITPAWVESLSGPILADGSDFVTPVYTRDRHEVTINDMIAYPLTRALYGRDVRQPLGGEVAMSPRAWRLFLDRDVWETDVARFGIHIWMTTLAVNAGWRMHQAPLGTKTHNYKDPTVGFEPKFLQIVGTMLRLMQIYRRVWPGMSAVTDVPLWGKLRPRSPEPVPTTRKTLWDGFRKGMRRYRRNLHHILGPDDLGLLDELQAGERPKFPADSWARIVFDVAVVYNRGEGDPDKVALSLLPLYYARKATMLRGLEGRPWTAVESAIRSQAGVFMAQRDYLVKRWSSYLPWQAPIR